MAAAVLSAELRLRDGQRKTVRVQTGSGTELGSLITAVRELSHSVTCLLTELVQREQSQGTCSAEVDGEDSEDSEDNEDEQDLNMSGPEPKRTKT